MAKVYKNQTYFTLILDTGENVTGATALSIHYRKPSGTTGSLEAIQEGLTSVRYNFTSTVVLNEAGEWKFWAVVTFADGRTAPGEPLFLMVYEPGT